MDQPQRLKSVFLGSSQEGMPWAQGFFNNFHFDDDIDLRPWWLVFDEGPFVTTLEQLEQLTTFDFGVVLMTPDDITGKRGQVGPSPRDNLLFETGLLMAGLERSRVFPIVPKTPKIHLPSDFLGARPLEFDFNATGEAPSLADCAHAMLYASNIIRDRIKSLGPRPTAPGVTAKDYQSGIRFHQYLMFDKAENRLRFRVGYGAPGSLLDVQFRAYHVVVDESGEGRYWNDLGLSTESLPELVTGWITSHRIDDASPFSQLDPMGRFPGKIALFVSGIDSRSMSRRFNKHFYRPEDIKQGRFAHFARFSEDGETREVNWSEFDNWEQDNSPAQR